jgi:serine/threonine-protein kinase
VDERSAARQALRLVTPESKVTTPDKLGSSSGIVAAAPQVPLASIRPGVVVNSKYLVGEIIGEGGVGIVYAAQNLELDEKVALKCLRPEMLIDPAIVARFAREAKAAASIKSEYVATVHDVGTMPDGSPFMVMEFLEGKDLGAVMQEQGVLGPRAASECALQVCEALAVAHAKGIVHRDIKPENLMLTERTGGMRIVKVLDFGISKAALTGSIFRSDLPLVKTVSLMGTPLYMSPEQVRSTESVDVRSDVWSLGMVLYELLTGTTAFSASSITELCAMILEAPPTPLERHRKDLPSGLVDVVSRCLEKDPGRRYQNVAELALALMPFGPKRARINVERAIAVLQGSGMLDVHLRLLSTVPPPNGEYTLDSIPANPRVPSGITPVASAGAPSSARMLAAEPSGPSLPAQVALPGPYDIDPDAPPPNHKGRTIVILGVLLAAAGIVIAVLATRGSGAPPAAEASKAAATAPPAVTATAAAPDPAATAPAQHPAAPQPPETTSAAVTSTATAVTARALTAAAPQAPLPQARPVFTGGQRPVVVRPRPGAGASATAAPSGAAKPADGEPDLGY